MNDGHKPCIVGWLIRRLEAGEFVDEAFNTAKGQFDHWMAGNLFHSEQAAIAYAEEFGIKLGIEADVFRYEF